MKRPRGSGRALAPAVFVFAAALLLYLPSVRFGFIEYDDPLYVTANPVVREGLGAGGLRWSLTSTQGGSWHPLTWLSHMADVELFGLWAGGHHLTNILLHAASSGLLAALLLRMTGAPWPSAGAAALFALHPLHVESVAWVAERKDVLSGLLFFLTLLAYAGHAARPSRARLGGALAFYALGLGAKPMLVTLPLVMLVLDWWPLGRLRGRRAHPARLVLEKAPFMAMSAAVGVLTYLAQARAGALRGLGLFAAELRPGVAAVQAANAVKSTAVYLVKAVWPARLAVFYPYPVHDPLLWLKAAGALSALLALGALAWRLRRSSPHLMAGFLWYLVMLSPVVGLVQAGTQGMADRYTYLPLIGPFLALAWVAGGARPVAAGSRIKAATLLLVLALLAAVSARQLGYWRDSVRLFERALAAGGDNWLMRNNLGVALERRGRPEEAIAHYRKALEIRPAYRDAANNLAVALIRLGRFQEAEAPLSGLVAARPDDAEALNNLGLVRARLGRFGEAEATYRRALGIAPGEAQIHFNLALVLAAQGRIPEARRSLAKTLELQADFPGAGRLLGEIPDPGEAFPAGGQ